MTGAFFAYKSWVLLTLVISKNLIRVEGLIPRRLRRGC